MNEMMTFPDTWEEFEKLYGFNDAEEIYTNNSRLIPSFRVKQWLDHLPSVQGKPFNLPEIYIAEGYDTIEDEDGNVGFGVYVPDEKQIYVVGDVDNEVRLKALFHELCHWVQDMCGRPFDEDEANRFAEVVYDALPSAQPRKGKWIDYSDEGYVECPFCHSATNCEDNKDELHYCFSCGADMREGDAE